MVMWSELKRFAIRDAAGHYCRLADATLDLGTGDYPTVLSLVPRHAPAARANEIAWDQVESIDWRRRVITIAEQPEAEPLSRDKVRIDRDVLDALILDVGR